MKAAKEPRHLYLIYGNNETAVSNARYELVTSLLTPEERDSGLTEIEAPANQPLTLDRAMDEILGELGTASFLADSRRVVVVHQLRDLLSTGRRGRGKSQGKKASARQESFLNWLRDVLPTTENIAIFVCTESDEKQRTVDEKSDLFQFLKKHGEVIQRREKALNFEFEDNLLSGNGPGALMVLRDWIKRAGNDSSGRLRIYTTLSGVVELSLQAACQQEGRERGVPNAHIAVNDFPNLQRIPDWKAKKIRQFAQRFSTDQLHRIVARLNKLQRLMYPSGDENYVANWEDYIEVVVMELTLARH